MHNAVETGVRDQVGGHAGTHMEGLVTSWSSGVSCDRGWACKQLHGPWDQCSHMEPHSPPLSLYTALEASDGVWLGTRRGTAGEAASSQTWWQPASIECDLDP